MADTEKLKLRLKAAKDKRRFVEAEIDQAYRYVFGTSFTNPSNEPDRSEIHDTTVTTGVGDLVTVIMTHLLPQDKNWVGFSLSKRFIAMNGQNTEMSSRVSAAESIYFEHVNGSDFYLSSSEALTDAVIAGTGAIGVTVGDDGLCYRCLPISQIYYLTNGYDIDVVFREHKLPARTLVERYKKVPDWIRDLAKDKPEETVDIVESMVPGKKRGHFDYSVHATKDWAELHSQDCSYKPFIVFRFDRANGQTCWSGSPVRTALPDIITVNKIMGDLKDDAAFIGRPTYFVEGGMSEGLLDYKPGTIMSVEGNGIPKPLPRSGDLTVHVNQIAELRNAINRTLMADVLPQGDRMTTAEVQVRTEKFFRRIGVHALRLEEEFLQPVVRSTVTALQTNKMLGPFTLDGDLTASREQREKAIIMSTRSLRQRVEAQASIDNYTMAMQRALQMTEFAKGLIHVKSDDVGPFVLKQYGFPMELIRSEEEVKAMTQATNVVQAAGGVAAMEGGQTNEATNKATGQAIAGLLPELAKAA